MNHPVYLKNILLQSYKMYVQPKYLEGVKVVHLHALLTRRLSKIIIFLKFREPLNSSPFGTHLSTLTKYRRLF